MGARQVHDINKVSNLEDMKKWNVPGQYNRPICRRIVEELNVPRSAFGQRKQITTIELSHRWTFIPDNSQKNFYSWLNSQRHIFKQKKKIFPDYKVRFIVNTYRKIILKSSFIILKIFGKNSNSKAKLKYSYAQKRLRYDCWFEYLFPWAVEKAKEMYKPGKLK
jgi:hypothetical protein